MQVDFIKSKEEWENFLIINNGSFLQSSAWYKFKKKYQDGYQLEVRDKDKVTGLCQFFKERTPFGNYFYIPHGPLAINKKTINALFEKITEIGKKENIIFVKTEPLYHINIGVDSFSRIQPHKTLILDINKKNNEILQSFTTTTRRNITVAKKKGVYTKTENNIDLFFKLLQKTKSRQKFSSYNKDYFSSLLKDTPSHLSCAYYKNSVIAANVVLYYNKTAYCLHSATDHSYRNLKGANLLRYNSIIKARDSGLTKFDNWGIDEVRFPGVTNFKKGFGGNKFVYPSGKDIVLKKTTYKLYRFSFLIKKRI